MEKIWFVGGSTCCGKSTITEALAKKHGLGTYKLDDHLEEYMQRLAANGSALCQRSVAMTMEEMWMRDPAEMCAEEIAIYRELFPLALKDARAMAEKGPVIAEGAGFLPDEIARAGVEAGRFICLVPTPEFQLEKYAQREWISYYLADTSDGEKAFGNWMQRDALFARWAKERAEANGHRVLVVDGSSGIEENMAQVERHFELAE